MIAATRRWVRRNTNNLVIGAGVIGAGYLAGQYVVNKIQEAQQRMSEDRLAKEKYVQRRWNHAAEWLMDSFQPSSKIRAKSRRLHIHSLSPPANRPRRDHRRITGRTNYRAATTRAARASEETEWLRSGII